MFYNNLKTALRNFRKYPGYSFLNLFGLALGLAASFTLLLYSYRELSYENEIEARDRIYRVATDFYNMGGFAKSQRQLLDFLPQECPDVELGTRFDKGFRETVVRVGETEYLEPHYYFVDTNFFELFSYHFLKGNPEKVLRSPDEVVISETLAKKYFGEESPLGQTLEIGKEKKPFRVSGVVEKMGRTHLTADIWMPMEKEEIDKGHWTNIYYYNYVRMREGSGRAELEAGLAGVLKNHAYPAAQTDASFEAWKASDPAVHFFVQPLQDIYLHSDYQFEVSPGGNPLQVYILGVVGLFILLIAGVNYINLTTARSAIRAKEIGVKKTLGARRPVLVYQFLTESLLNSFLALLLAFVLAHLLLAFFGDSNWASLLEYAFSSPRYVAALLLFTLLVGLLSGLYPAFYLSGFRPAEVIKGEFALGGNGLLRSGLVVLQFAIAAGLVLSSIVVYQQLQYMQHKDMGFDTEGVMVIENAGALKEKAEAFRTLAEQQSQVERTGFSARTPTGSGVWMYTYQTPQMKESITMQTFPVDDQFLPTLGMRIAEGRNFSREMGSDSSAVIINEAAVKAFGLEEPIGAEVNEGQRVVGVVHDFNFQSLHKKIEPVVLTYSTTPNDLAIKLKRGDVAGFIATLKEHWRSFSPDEPMRYFFLDDNFAQLAADEKALSRAISFFTLLALIIAALGLLGLAAFTAEQRTKEIGIRKILGATIRDIVSLLSRDFLKLVGIALFIALPLGWFAMEKWLQNFAYRIDIPWWGFLLTAALAIVVAFLAVSYQSLRAALSNPVEALRKE